MRLWTSDGTEAGTTRLGDAHPGFSPSTLTAAGTAFFFTAADASGNVQVWRTDATGAVVQLTDFVAGSTSIDTSAYEPSSLTACGASLYFIRYDDASAWGLWKTDGTSSGTVKVADFGVEYPEWPMSTRPSSLTALGSFLYLTAHNSNPEDPFRYAWRTDGTDLMPVGDASWNADEPASFTAFGQDVYYFRDGDLLRSDGSPWNAVQVGVELGIPGSEGGRSLAVAGSRLFVAASDTPASWKLWSTDGTAGGTVLAASGTGAYGSAGASLLTAAGTSVFFAATDVATGKELWTSDGTATGTGSVKDINTATADDGAERGVRVGNTVYFAATDGPSGKELWKTDGTAAGTVRIRDIKPGLGSSDPADLTVIGSTVFFTADNGVSGRELWKTDGTEAGTVLVKDLYSGSAWWAPTSLTAVGSTLFFTANDGSTGWELWKSDGTESGTVQVADIAAGAANSNPWRLTAVGSTLYFSASDAQSDYELWKSDGTATGTVRVKDIQPGNGGSNPTNLTAVGSTLFFAAYTAAAGQELWTSDGTEAGTVRVLDINPGTTGSDPQWLTAIGSTLYFTAADSVHLSQVWRTDGTEAGTVRLTDVRDPFLLTAVGSRLVFWSRSDATGWEPWSSDGTTAGTALVKDINPGSQGSVESSIQYRPGNRTVVGSKLFFNATDGVHGSELWETDGTSAGTKRVSDIHPGAAGSNPVILGDDGLTLFFTAADGAHGRELWRLRLSLAPTVLGLSAASVAEGSPSGTLVGTFSAVDGDVGDTFTYALVEGDGDDDNAAFTIVGNELRAVSVFDHEARPSLTLRVRVTDAGGLSLERSFTIRVSDVVERPVLDISKSPALAVVGDGAPIAGSDAGSVPVSSLIDEGGPLGNFVSSTGGLPGIALTGLDPRGGRVWFSVDAGASWREVGAVSDTFATLLVADASTRLFFSPAAGFGGSIADVLTIRAWDRSGGFVNGAVGVNTRVSDPIVGTSSQTGFFDRIVLSQDGRYAFVSDSIGGIQVMDLADPRAPVRVGGLATSGSVQQIALSADGSLAFVAGGGGGLHVVDVGDRANPVRIGGCATSGFAYGVALSPDGRRAYVAMGDAGLRVVDVTDPADPISLGDIDTSGLAYDVTLSADGGYAFVADLSGGLKVVDVGDPAGMTVVKSLYAGAQVRSVTLSADGMLAYVAVEEIGLRVLDVHDPADPAWLAVCDTPGAALRATLSADGRFAVVADAGGGIHTIDVTDPFQPTLVRSFDTGQSAYDVALSGDGRYAYVAGHSGGMLVVDLVNPVESALVGRLATGGYATGSALSADGRYAYVAAGDAGLKVIDVSDPAHPVALGAWSTSAWASAVVLTPSGRYAVVVDDSAGIQVIDVGDPAHPVRVGGYDTPGTARSVVLSADGLRAFVVDSEAGLVVLDLADPASPTVVVAVGLGPYGRGVAMSTDGRYVLVAAIYAGLYVIDVGEPSSPFIAGFYDSPYAVDVAVHGDRAVIVMGDHGLDVVDLSDPHNPVREGALALAGYSRIVAIAPDGRHAFVGSYGHGVQIVDLFDAAAPVRVGRHFTGDWGASIAFSGDGRYAFVADAYSGLTVLDAYVGRVAFSADADSVSVAVAPPPTNDAPTGISFANTVAVLADTTSTQERLRVADIVIEDDGLGVNTITLSGADAASFEVVDSALYLKAGVALDAGSKAAYDVTVEVADQGVAGSAPVSVAFTLSIVPAVGTFGDFAYAIADGAATITACAAGVQDVVIPESIHGFPVTRVGNQAFFGHQLRSIVFPEGLTSIGVQAFSACRNLEAVSLPASVTGVEAQAFAFCTALTGFTVAQGNPAFQAVDGILLDAAGTDLLQAPGGRTAVVVPAGVVNILNYAFMGCQLMTSVTLPEGLETIGYQAFNVCSQLVSLRLPASFLPVVLGDSFQGCDNFVAFEVDGANPSLTAAGGVLYDKAVTVLRTVPAGLRTLVVPEGVTRVDYRAASSSRLESIAFPESLTRIGEYSFAWSGGLTSVTIPGGVTVIEPNAFAGCWNLAALRFQGDPPAVTGAIAPSTQASAYYPAANAAWAPYAGGTFGGLPTIAVSPNDAPTAVTLAAAVTTLRDDTSTESRVRVADIVIDDDGEGANVTTLSGADADSFEVVDGALWLKAGVALDARAKPRYEVTVTVIDESVAGSGPVTAGLVIRITELLRPVAYSMPQGDSGSFQYWDDGYSGSGGQGDSAPLSGGLGQLTDGIVGADDWAADLGNGNAREWVGWVEKNPDIIFDLGVMRRVTGVRVHANSAGYGGVGLFAAVTVSYSDDGVTWSAASRHVTSAAERADTRARFHEVGGEGVGRFARVSIERDAPWIFVSEIEFTATPAVVWDGGAGTRAFLDAANWADDVLPQAGDLVRIDGSAGDPPIVVEGVVTGVQIESARSIDLAGGTFDRVRLPTIGAAALVSSDWESWAAGWLVDSTVAGTVDLATAGGALNVSGTLTLEEGTILLGDRYGTTAGRLFMRGTSSL
ncbi:MAG: ELWxxDGT repeat protein [Planctomycetaceae bacterium]